MKKHDLLQSWEYIGDFCVKPAKIKMIPTIDYLSILQFLQVIVDYLKIRRMERKENESEMEVITIINMTMHIFSCWIDLTKLIHTSLQCKVHKKRLFQPHLLLQIFFYHLFLTYISAIVTDSFSTMIYY